MESGTSKADVRRGMGIGAQQTSGIQGEIPQWIWHEEREKRLSVRLSREFALERTAADARLWVAATGGVKVYLDGREYGEIPDHPQNVAQFSRVESFPGSLSPGPHRLEIAAACSEPMPVGAVGIHLADRRVGCAAFLQGSGLWLATDAAWRTDDGATAAVVCRYGEEPYGDLENSPEWFIAGGYGDIVVTPVSDFAVLWSRHAAACIYEGELAVRGRINKAADISGPKRDALHLFYHLRKQAEWKELREAQETLDLSQFPRIDVDLLRERNVRMRVRNAGGEPLRILWNGAESLPELERYGACITELVEIPAGEVRATLPQGLRYVRLYFLGAETESLQAVITFESAVAQLKRVGSFHSDVPAMNEIFEVASHTNEVCHQIGLWDGIKRDRLNWTYDFYMAAKTDYVLWDDLSVLRRSLHELGAGTPYGFWMNSISAYTLWWINNMWEYYWHTGDRKFVLEMKEHIAKHALFVGESLDPRTGFFKERHTTLIEWVPMSENEAWLCLHALLIMTKANLLRLQKAFPELDAVVDWSVPVLEETAFLSGSALITPLLGIISGCVGETAAAHFLKACVLADPVTPLTAYWLAECYAAFGMVDRGWNAIETVWGYMLRHGATSFWEGVTLRIPEAADFHAVLTTYQAYDSYRMSLCHSWASTPGAWLMRHVLGIEPLEPGYRTVAICPGPVPGMTRCEGTVNTLFGPLCVAWQWNGERAAVVVRECPPGVRVV